MYEAPATGHAEIITAANTDKRIVRLIDLLTTKDAARHAVEMRELSLKTPERAGRVEDAEVVAGAELDVALEHLVV